MVYMGGDNGTVLSSLEDAGNDDLMEMKQVGSTNQVNVVAQFDRMSDHRTRRYYITKGGNATRDEVADLGPTDTGDPRVLCDFIAWAVANYPAERYALVLWNHGTGWKEDDVYGMGRRLARAVITSGQARQLVHRRASRAFFSTTMTQILGQPPARRGILFDDSSKDFLDNLELANVLDFAVQTIGRKLDLLGMDACLMSMLEVAYQSRRGATVMVGSEETEPGDGWPYHRVLAALTANPQMTPQQLGTIVVQEYVASYDKGPLSEAVTQSALDLGQAQSVVAAVDALAQALIAGLQDHATYMAIAKARRDTQSFYDRDYLDLYNLATLLHKYCQSPEIRAAAQRVIDLLQPDPQAGFVLGTKSLGREMAESHGVSIYFPPEGRVSPFYSHLEMSKATHWDDFLEKFATA